MKRLKKGQGIAWLIAFVLCLGLLGYYAMTVIQGTIKANDTSLQLGADATDEQKAQMDKYNADSLKLGLDLDGGVSITYEAVGDKAPTDEQMNDTKFLKLVSK